MVNMTCQLCRGPLGILGELGSLRWYQCRNCGMQYSKTIKRRTKTTKVKTNKKK